MSNTYYSQGHSRAQEVQKLFAAIASRYDLINDIQSFGMHRYWKKEVLKIAGLGQQNSRALDVCCGTGDLALGLAANGFQVTAIDFSEPMLAIARAKTRSHINSAFAGINNPDFLPGDAMSLSFPDNCFDVVTVGYGLRNLADWKKGLEEMRRVCRVGGKIICLDFGRPSNGLMRGIYFGYLRLLVPVFGKVFCGNSEAYRYILESLQHFPAQRGIHDQLQRLGCTEVRIVDFVGGSMAINCAIKSV